jgi:serine/threonine protein kinase
MSSDEKFTKKLDPHSVYELGQVLGNGAFGSVYHAVDKQTKRAVALKKLSVSGEQINEVLNEIDIMKDVKSPYVVHFYGNYFHGAAIYIAMELCVGGSVQGLVSTLGSLSEAHIGPVAKSCFGGLDYMHRLSFVHRDIKPGNILITADGRVKLADFGISSRNRSRMHTLIGTPHFLAPEIISGDETGYTSKVDVWALGISIIHMATGKPPYSDLNPMRALFLISAAPPPRLPTTQKWSADLLAVIEHTLVADPAVRYSCAQALELAFIKSAADHLPSAAAPAAAHDSDDEHSNDDIVPLNENEKSEMKSWLHAQAVLEAKTKQSEKTADPEELLKEAEQAARKVHKKRRKDKDKSGNRHKKSSGSRKVSRASTTVAPAPAVTTTSTTTSTSSSTLSKEEKELFDEIVRVRQSPSAYADVIEKSRIGKYNSADNSVTVGRNIFDTTEGESGAREAIAALRQMGGAALPELSMPDGMMRALRLAVQQNGNKPNALALLDDFGSSDGTVKQSSVLGMDSAQDIVIFMLIDDGNKERTKRKTLLDKSLRHIGISISAHPDFESLALFLFAESWQEKK